MAGSSAPTIPSLEEVAYPGRVLFRSGVSADILKAGLRLGEGAFTTDNYYGWLGDESQKPPCWPTSKTTGNFDWTNLNPSYNNINVKTINNTDLGTLVQQYIKTGPEPVITIINDKITKKVYGPDADFVDLSAAYLWLSQRTISASGFVTLQLARGTFNHTSDINLTHPNGERIAIIGTAIASPFPKNVDYQITGYSPAQRASDTAANLTLLKKSYTTILNMLNGSSVIIGSNLSNMQDVLVYSDGSIAPGKTYTSGIVVNNSNAKFTRCAVCGYQLYNFYVYKANVNLMENFVSMGSSLGAGIATGSGGLIGFGPLAQACLLSNGGNGAEITGQGILTCNNYEQIYSNLRSAGNGGVGLLGGQSNIGGFISLISELNGNNGISLSQSTFGLVNAIVRNNAGYGTYVGDLSSIFFNGLTMSGQGTGIYAFNGAYVSLFGTINITSTSTNYSPALGTVGNRNAQIFNA